MEIRLGGIAGNWKKNLLFIPIAIIGATTILYVSGIVNAGQEIVVIGYAHEAVLWGLGAGLFIFGFIGLRKKRLIEDTPTAKIRSVAMGLTEVTGLARAKYSLKSPLSGADCVYFRFLVEKETRGSRNRRYWRKVNEGMSATYFYVEDNSGKILVDPMCSEGILARDYYVTDTADGLFGNRMRYSEWYIVPGDYVYVIGSVKKFKDAGLDRKERLAERLRQTKQDAEKMKAFDIDGDGQVGVEEWDRARRKVEEDLFREELSCPPAQEDDLVIAQGDIEKTFILSDRDEKEVASSIGIRCFFAAAGGGILMIGMAASFLARTGFLASQYAIPWHMFYRH